MSKKFNPRSWSAPVEDLVSEYEAQDKAERTPEVATEPDAINSALVKKGLLDPNTGEYQTSNKASTIMAGNCRGYSRSGKASYRRTFGHD